MLNHHFKKKNDFATKRYSFFHYSDKYHMMNVEINYISSSIGFRSVDEKEFTWLL